MKNKIFIVMLLCLSLVSCNKNETTANETIEDIVVEESIVDVVVEDIEVEENIVNELFTPLEIISEKEVLYEIDVTGIDINYSHTEEGLSGLESSLVMENGNLVFYKTYNDDNTYTYSNLGISKSAVIPNVAYYDADFAVSQQGVIKMDDGFYVLSQKKKYNYEDITQDYIKRDIIPEYFFDVPNGLVCYWESDNKALGFYFVENQFGVIDTYDLNLWLMQQGFNFDPQTNQVLKENVIVSPSKPKDQGGKYCGKLKNGFSIYSYGDSYIFITDSTGNVVLKSFIPWSYDNPNDEEKRFFYYGIGPYGEIYYSLAPIYDEIEKNDHYIYKQREGSNPEIAVVRNYLKYFGVLTDDAIRLRSGPTTTSESLGTYPVNTGFVILEKGNTEETIGGDTGVWYKVRLLDGKEGYFFGAYVSDLYDGPGTPLPWPNVADWK